MQGGRLRARVSAGACALALLFGCGSAEEAHTGTPEKPCGKVVLDGGGGILAPPDGAAAPECQPGSCNYQLQAGCAEGQSCLPNAVGSAIVSSCFDAGPQQLGTACDGANACVTGLACVAGRCRKLCCAGDWTVCDEGESCYTEFLDPLAGDDVPTGAWVCSPVDDCDVLDPEACDELGGDCKLVDARGSTACVPKTPGALGEPCSAASGRLCGRGLLCVGKPGAEKCIRLCRAEACGEPSCPTSEGTCVHFDRDPLGVGECTQGR